MERFFLLEQFYNVLVFVLALMTSLYLFVQKGNSILREKNISLVFALMLALVLLYIVREQVSVLGHRPGNYDIYMYVNSYNQVGLGVDLADSDAENINGGKHEPGWAWLNTIFNYYEIDVFVFFLFIHIVYIGCQLLACILLLRGREWLGFLFFVTSLSFIGYANNGLRNGMACSLMIIAIIYMNRGRFEQTISVLLMLAAISIHRSTLIPVVAFFISRYILKETKPAIVIWFSCLLLSLVSGNAFGDFFANMGFDERESYFADASNTEIANIFSSTGFRWDFLMYSFMPIILIWYLTEKRNFRDKVYNLIANTYILSNSFWLLVIRATYSNRFAYLSWFIYPLLFAYPLLRFNIWDDQDKRAAMILASYSGFTFLISLF